MTPKADLQRLDDIFLISGGHQLSKRLLTPVGLGGPIAYVSRTHRRNGIDGFTGLISNLQPSPAGSISVCLRSRNHALASFVQPMDFYTSYHVAVLSPLKEMPLSEKLWWCKCIESNRFRFNFGRQANRTLASLPMPASCPSFVSQIPIPSFESRLSTEISLASNTWGEVRLVDLFDIEQGRRETRRSARKGLIPWISGSRENNGISAYVEGPSDFPGGCLTVANNGSVGAAFYQPDPFVASSDVTILRPKFQMSIANGIFICALLRHESIHYNYARKWTLDRMNATILRVPISARNEVDFIQMESIIQALPMAAFIL